MNGNFAMPDERKARAIGFNHVALEVGDIDEALAFYARCFEFGLRTRSATVAFIDLGDHLGKYRAFPGVRGNGITSRTLARPVMYATVRSNPRPNPAWGTVP